MTATPPPSSSASIRRRITSATAALTAAGMTALIIAVLLVAGGTTQREMDGVLNARIQAVRSTTTVTGGVPRPARADDALFDTRTWVASASGTIIAGPRIEPAELESAVRRLAISGDGAVTQGHWRLLAAPLREHHRVGRVVVAVDAGPYTSGLAKVTAASVALGVIVVLGTTLLARRIVTRALAPVARMSQEAEAWSHDRLEHRFALGRPRDEISGLAAVLDGLLDRVSGAIRAEQRLTAELAHELRTPLTVIRGEAELGAATRGVRRGDRARYDRIVAAADDMGAAMTTLLDAARTPLVASTCDVGQVLAAIAARPGLALPVAVDPVPAGLTAAVPADLLERAVAPLVENAVRHAATDVRIAAAIREDRVEVRVTNDGEGVPDLAGDPFDPGVRDERSQGAGLGLALCRRLARTAGGEALLLSRRPAVFAVLVPAA